jgi:hypothetical protein
LSSEKDLNRLEGQLSQVKLDIFRELIEPEEFKAWAEDSTKHLILDSDKEKALNVIAQNLSAEAEGITGAPSH